MSFGDGIIGANNNETIFVFSFERNLQSTNI